MTRRKLLLLWLGTLALLVGIVIRTPFSTDMSAFLPTAPSATQQVLVDQLRDGVASRLILIAIEGPSAAVRAQLSRDLANQLRPRGEFVRIENGDGGTGKAEQAFVWANRYLLSPRVDPERFSTAGLREALDRNLELLASGLEPLLKDGIVRDVTGEALGLAKLLGEGRQRETEAGVWASARSGRALLLVQTRAAGFDIDAQAQALRLIEQAFTVSQARVTGAAGARLVLSGPGVFGVRTETRMKHDVTLYSTVASGLIVTLLLLVYRSPRLVLFTLVPVVTAALAGLAAVRLYSGFVHGITLGFGITLIGEAVDYAIYFFMQGRDAGQQYAGRKRLWPTLLLGVSVSICGFAAMLFSSFIGFVQLGIFTIVGLVVALAVTRFVLPAIVPATLVWSAEPGGAAGLPRIVQHAQRLRLPVLILTLLAVVFIAGQWPRIWQDELSSMSPVSPSDQQLDRQLRSEMGAPDVRYLVMISASTREALLEASEDADQLIKSLIGEGTLAGLDAPSRYLPGRKTQERRRAALPAREDLARNLAAALEGSPFRKDAFVAFLDEVEAARHAPFIDRAALEGTALSLQLDALLTQRHDRWYATLPLREVVKPERISQALARQWPDGAVQLLDLKAESDHLLRSYRQEALALAGAGVLAIAGVLWLRFRSIRQAFIVLLPLGVAAVLTVAILLLARGQISIFNLFGLLLVVAVGSNYCLFFQRGGFAERHGERTVLSLLIANLCTVIGFGALSLSQIPVLFDIGRTVAIGTALSLLAAAVLVPDPGPQTPTGLSGRAAG